MHEADDPSSTDSGAVAIAQGPIEEMRRACDELRARGFKAALVAPPGGGG